MELAIFQEYSPALEWLGSKTAWFLIFAGFMAFVWMLAEGFRRGGFLRPKKEEAIHDEINVVLKVIIYSGIILGVISIVAAVASMIIKIAPSDAYANNYPFGGCDILTSVSLLIMGFAMFIKPMKDIPWAALIGLIAGIAIGLVVIFAIPETTVAGIQLLFGWEKKWVLLGIFIIVATVIGVLVKFWMHGLEMVSRFVSWPPVALIMGIYCLIQGFLVLIGGKTLWLIQF